MKIYVEGYGKVVNKESAFISDGYLRNIPME